MEKTGFTYIDELSNEERIQAFKNMREFWNSLTVEERTRYFDRYYTAIREKMKSKGGLITQEQAIREIINVDVPKIKERTIKKFEEHGRFDIAEDLRRRRLGVDTFAIELIAEDENEKE